MGMKDCDKKGHGGVCLSSPTLCYKAKLYFHIFSANDPGQCDCKQLQYNMIQPRRLICQECRTAVAERKYFKSHISSGPITQWQKCLLGYIQATFKLTTSKYIFLAICISAQQQHYTRKDGQLQILITIKTIKPLGIELEMQADIQTKLSAFFLISECGKIDTTTTLNTPLSILQNTAHRGLFHCLFPLTSLYFS